MLANTNWNLKKWTNKCKYLLNKFKISCISWSHYDLSLGDLYQTFYIDNTVNQNYKQIPHYTAVESFLTPPDHQRGEWRGEDRTEESFCGRKRYISTFQPCEHLWVQHARLTEDTYEPEMNQVFNKRSEWTSNTEHQTVTGLTFILSLYVPKLQFLTKYFGTFSSICPFMQ